jgi:RNA-directed DNA polymerase
MFRKLDSYLWEITWRWGKRRHPNKGHKWVANKYWTSEDTRNWIFKTKESKLLKFSDAKIRRHSLLKLDANPYLNIKLFHRKKGSHQKADTMDSNQTPIFLLEPPERVVKCASELRCKSHGSFLEWKE